MKRGDLLIELILAIGLLATMATMAIATMSGLLSLNRTAQENEVASLYAEEGVEAVRAIRDRDWNDLSDGTHGLNWNGTQWEWQGTSDQRDKYARQVEVATARRDSQGNLVASGGTADPNTKMITVRVSWQVGPNRPGQVELKTYLTRWRKAQLGGGNGIANLNNCDDACQNEGFNVGHCRSNCQNSETRVGAFAPYCSTSNQNCCCGN